MEYMKALISIVCLFDLESEDQQAISMNRFRNIKSKQFDCNQQKFINENTLIQQLCKSLEREDKGTIAPWIKTYKNKKILLLDLDKTLIYYTPKTGLILRPLLNHFFRQLKGVYSIYIFTSATKSYVRQVLQKAKTQKSEIVNINGILSRQNCIKIEKDNAKRIYVKDLSILTNCSLSDVVIVDDLPVSYCLHQENAIPITPFSGQAQDQQLKRILEILLKCSQYEDVRDYLTKANKNFIKTQIIKDQNVKSQKNIILKKQ